MFTFETKQVVFQGLLRPFAARLIHSAKAAAPPFEPLGRYWVLSQNLADIQDRQNSPSVSMWGFLLASAQTQRLNEISIYVERGSGSDDMRLLYMNDFALLLWKQMDRAIKIRGRLPRPPRAAVLSFGMPFANS